MTHTELLEIRERSKYIALMLGYTDTLADTDFYFATKKVDYLQSSPIPNLIELNFEKRFYSDWNWLMEAVDFIEKNHAWVNIKGCAVDISTAHSVSKPSKKEATFIAVSDFAKALLSGAVANPE